MRPSAGEALDSTICIIIDVEIWWLLPIDRNNPIRYFVNVIYIMVLQNRILNQKHPHKEDIGTEIRQVQTVSKQDSFTGKERLWELSRV